MAFNNSTAALSLPKPAATGTAVDLLAIITGTALAVLGVCQVVLPSATSPLTGLDAGIGSQIIAAQWLLFAVLLLVGGVVRLRVVTIFASEFVMIGSIAALGIVLFREPGSMAVLVHGAIAVLAFACGGIARLTDKANLKHEVKLLRQQLVDGDKRAHRAAMDEQVRDG